VTIFGESAGSWSVNTLVASPLAKGLFQRAIGESGGAFPHDAYLREDRNKLPAAEKVGAAFARAAGAESFKALRAMPAEKIVEVFTNDPEGRKFRTQVNVDGWVLPDETSNIFAQRKHNDVPAIVGSNLNEMTTLTTPAIVPKTLEEFRKRIESQYGEGVRQFDAVYPVKSVEDIKDAYLGSLRDSIFSLPMRTWARVTAGGRSKAYLYLFSHVRPGPNSKYNGAFHASEILYVFGNLNPNNKVLQDTDFKLSAMMTSYWVNFATMGDPNGTGLVKWTPYDRGAEPYLEFGDTIQLRNHLLREQLDFLEEFQRSSSAAN
jgi:para-nitrobenzyl esterase